jgi:hypothetical protein
MLQVNHHALHGEEFAKQIPFGVQEYIMQVSSTVVRDYEESTGAAAPLP